MSIMSANPINGLKTDPLLPLLWRVETKNAFVFITYIFILLNKRYVKCIFKEVPPRDDYKKRIDLAFFNLNSAFGEKCHTGKTKLSSICSVYQMHSEQLQIMDKKSNLQNSSYFVLFSLQKTLFSPHH